VREAALLSLVLMTLLLLGCMRCDFEERHDEHHHPERRLSAG